MLNKKTNNSGFTLVEISLVIVIIGVLIGMVAFSTQARMQAAKIYMTKQRMQTVMDALDRYVELYGYLPCPVDPTISASSEFYGTGDGENNVGMCKGNGVISIVSQASKGMIPFKLLGLDPQMAVDGWGMRFDYIVTDLYTGTTDFTDSNSYNDKGNFYHIWQQNGVNLIDKNEDLDVAYILMSHGANTYGGYRDKNGTKYDPGEGNGPSSEEYENYDDDEFFYQYLPTSRMDDIVIIKPRWQMPTYINQQ